MRANDPPNSHHVRPTRLSPDSSTRQSRQSLTVRTLSIAMMLSQTSESLVKRLAGPSTGKAGLAKDQTEINRIIAEASKGSRFYEVGLGCHGSIDMRYLNSRWYRMKNAGIKI